MATGCNRNEGREERGHLEIGESALALRTFPAIAVACKSVSTCITYVPSYCCCMQVCHFSCLSSSFMQGMLILCLAVGKMDINYPPSSFPMELPDTLKDFLAK